ncbi:hypothetical protein EV122DRAFT_214798 [Schizophyllum commune]
MRAEPADDIPQPAHSRQHRCRVFDNEQNPWYPWPDKETCVVDILRHVPRCAFSRKQNQVIHWAMAALGIEDAPSDRTMQDIDKKLQSICGVHSIRFVSAFSNIYYVNDIPALIAQEVANPRVRQHLHFLPEKVHGRVSEAWQASRWLDELDPDFLTQNIRKRDDPTQEFFIYEPALLRNGSVVMPVRWYIENKTIYAKGWNMSPDPLKRGWIVEEYSETVFSEHDLHLSLPLFAERHGIYQMPSPRVIVGEYSLVQILISIAGTRRRRDSPLDIWTRTNSRAGNKWRERAKGRPVRAFPLWTYCDDVSGNTSKKWNKHTSWLFTAAGLPRRLVHREYNVHFMTTSNIVSPLEMAEGVVAQIEEAQKHGIWAYDAKEHDYVLLIPSIFALLGDNPMQSELCCHSGMAANHFCRICWVEGTGMEDDEEGDTTEPQHPSHATSPSSSPGPAAPSRTPASGARTRLAETFEGMVSRLECFMSVGHRLRTKTETLGILEEQFSHAKRVGGKKALGASRTRTGIRDAYQDRFLAQLTQVTTKKSRRKVQKEADVASLLASFPDAARLVNPLCRLKELDAHADTPVEILHVILLGFVKYFWRDVIAHRLGKAEKPILKARLNSFDTSGLGIPPLSGDVLVDHAGSLVGRDFRAIAQVAPFVLHGLGIEDNIIRVWMALSKVIPLVWQPEIEDMDDYLARLREALRYLLDCTCQFDAQWFNKPKFHIVLHLPEHIRRFGPAMLFATEGFESFNAVVRAHSVHSNRHAPSRDIARSMAQSNRVRHLISGGYFRIPSEQDLSKNGFQELVQSISPWIRQVQLGTATRWRSVSKPPQNLASRGNFARNFLSTSTASQATTIVGTLPSYAASAVVYTPQTASLTPKDRFSPGGWVLASPLASSGPDAAPDLMRVVEIVQVDGSAAQRRGEPDLILAQTYEIGEAHEYYEMPVVRPGATLRALEAEEILCPANVAHNCKDNRCELIYSHIIHQEAEETAKRAKRVLHRNPEDLVLNTAQMRSSKYFTKLYTPIPVADRSSIVRDAARKLLEKQKRRQKPAAVPTETQAQDDTNSTSVASSARQGLPSATPSPHLEVDGHVRPHNRTSTAEHSEIRRKSKISFTSRSRTLLIGTQSSALTYTWISVASWC